ncbi:hypothetical protein C8Q77DRAFT_131245 [Trametes polyzona]|nr:hypothetical protein C8Q77DRAFT_131245 [Trametes polyzona]
MRDCPNHPPSASLAATSPSVCRTSVLGGGMTARGSRCVRVALSSLDVFKPARPEQHGRRTPASSEPPTRGHRRRRGSRLIAHSHRAFKFGVPDALLANHAGALHAPRSPRSSPRHASSLRRRTNLHPTYMLDHTRKPRVRTPCRRRGAPQPMGQSFAPVSPRRTTAWRGRQGCRVLRPRFPCGYSEATSTPPAPATLPEQVQGMPYLTTVDTFHVMPTEFRKHAHCRRRCTMRRCSNICPSDPSLYSSLDTSPTWQ